MKLLKLKQLRSKYDELFDIILEDYIDTKEKRNILHQMFEISRKCTKIKKQLGIYAYDPCEIQKCTHCEYYYWENGYKQCDVKRNLKNNNGEFKGFSPTPEHLDQYLRDKQRRITHDES